MRSCVTLRSVKMCHDVGESGNMACDDVFYFIISVVCKTMPGCEQKIRFLDLEIKCDEKNKSYILAHRD